MLLSRLFAATALSSCLLLSACAPSSSDAPTRTERVENQSEALNAWFEARFEDELVRSPMTQSYFGKSEGGDRLDDSSQMAADETAALTRSWLEDMRRTFDESSLDDQAQLSYRLYEFAKEDELASHTMAGNDYVFQHMSGPHSDLPSFMINYHTVKTVKDAENYISRLRAFPDYLGQYIKRANTQVDNGVVLPKFVYAKISEASQNVIKGAPFTDGEDSPLFADISAKINALDIDDSAKKDLITQAKTALTDYVQPTYETLLETFARHEAIATDEDGAWKLPNGEAYYQTRLKHYTTTDLTSEEIHQIGLSEVARIQKEMQVIMDSVEFKGSLKEFYDFLRSDPQFQYPNTDAGRETYITEATAIIDDMKGRLDTLFITKPKADMVVKRVEPFREDTAFGAFYSQPSLDGARPGTYYINLREVGDQPTYLMQALAYHEGIPGHHMQIAIGMELQGLPKFRTLGGHTSYIEGWALYAESVPAELGLYTDPYKDFGRLSMEIFRAARLVVDTGIHSKKWTREQAVQYMMDNIANPEGDIRAEVDRYIVWPGQATAYKIGMLKIQELRGQAETALGDNFVLKEFHDVVLANGSVPLLVLEELVQDWITQKQET